MKNTVLSVLVSNHSGVLNRVTNLFGRRGFNIKGVTGAQTESPHLSRITILTEEENVSPRQICRQLEKLEDIHTTRILPADALVCRELLLFKLKLPAEGSVALAPAFAPFTLHLLAEGEGFAIAEVSCDSSQVDEVVALAGKVGILELCRTGAAALELGPRTIYPESIY